MQNLYVGNCLDVLKSLNDNSIDSIVTDPPYGLSFTGIELSEEYFEIAKKRIENNN